MACHDMDGNIGYDSKWKQCPVKRVILTQNIFHICDLMIYNKGETNNRQNRTEELVQRT